MKHSVTVLFLLFLLAGSAFSGEVREIELSDGSIITGEVISLSNGVYTIKSNSLGTVKLDESKIRSICAKGASSAAPDTGGQVKALQEQMMGNQEIMGMVQSLQNDPDFQKIMEDPEAVKAINSGDMAALMANPGFMKLLKNQTVQDIQRKVEK